MYKGKATCKILKEIRKQIAKENDIAFVTSECKYQGDCLGTCPACEAEVRYLEEELRKRKQLGKTAVVAGISLGLAATFAGCHSAKSPQPEPEEPTAAVFEQSEKSNVPAESANEENNMTPAAKVPRPVQRSSQDYMDFIFGGVEEEVPDQPSTMSSDTIEIVAELPDFDPDGTISSISTKSAKRIYSNQSNNIYTYAAYPPTFPGGDSVFEKKFYQKFHISKRMRAEFKGCNVTLQFIIGKNGKVRKASVLNSNISTTPFTKFDRIRTRKLEHAATHALRSLPPWNPGKNWSEKVVQCYQKMTIEIR